MADDDFDDARARSRASSAADATALASAFGAAGASEEAREYLAKQTALVDLQMENFRLENESLRKLDEYEVSHLRWRRFNDQMRGALQIVLVIVGVAVLIACGAAVWNASRAEGLVVDAFSVPPQFAQAGMGGDVIADDLTTRVAQVRDTANANSIAHSADVKKERDEEIKVDIPDTGISLGEVSRYLRSWLGHERHLSGNLRTAGDGKVTLSVALDGGNAMSFTGAPADLDKLEQQAAEHVFQSVDPSNYVLYLYGTHRPPAESLAAIQHLIRVADGPGESSDGYSLWGNWTRGYTGDLPLALARTKTARAINPKDLPPVMELTGTYEDMGRDEEALREARKMPSFRQDEQYAWKQGRGFGQVVEWGRLQVAVKTGDFAQAMTMHCGLCDGSDEILGQAEYAARNHDPRLSDRLIDEAKSMDGVDPSQLSAARYYAHAARDDWRDALADARAQMAAFHTRSPKLTDWYRQVFGLPPLAVALAHDGDFSEAHADIDGTADDCVPCETARGEIDALQKNYGGAAWWFARTIRDAPSIPFACANWGAMLLSKGDLEGAIAKFTLANLKGPHFADPLEMWGEALIRKNRSDLALAKFAEADKYAPNWGRLHLKWGEALLWSGGRTGAQKQFAMAASLELTASEKTEFARVSRN